MPKGKREKKERKGGVRGGGGEGGYIFLRCGYGCGKNGNRADGYIEGDIEKGGGGGR